MNTETDSGKRTKGKRKGYPGKELFLTSCVSRTCLFLLLFSLQSLSLSLSHLVIHFFMFYFLLPFFSLLLLLLRQTHLPTDTAAVKGVSVYFLKGIFKPLLGHLLICLFTHRIPTRAVSCLSVTTTLLSVSLGHLFFDCSIASYKTILSRILH